MHYAKRKVFVILKVKLLGLSSMLLCLHRHTGKSGPRILLGPYWDPRKTENRDPSRTLVEP